MRVFRPSASGKRGDPQRALPRTFAASRAALVRLEMASASCSATAAMICTVNLAAWAYDLRSPPWALRQLGDGEAFHRLNKLGGAPSWRQPAHGRPTRS